MNSSSRETLQTSCGGVTTRACMRFPSPKPPVGVVPIAITGAGDAVNRRFWVDMSRSPARVVQVEDPLEPAAAAPEQPEIH